MKLTKLSKSIIALICTASMLAVSGCSDKNPVGESGKDESTTTAAESNDTEKPDDTSDTEETKNPAEEMEDVEYKIEDGVTDKMIALSRYNEGNKVRLAEVFKKAQNGEEITVAYIGGSITQMYHADEKTCYARKTTDWLESTFPNAKINYVNAGIGATGSYIGVHRADADVLSKNPDLVFVEFSVNDTTENTQRNINAYDSLIQKLWNYETKPAIVTIAMTMEDGTSFQEYHGEIIKAYDIPMISYKNAIMYAIDKGYIKWTDISDDNIHPTTVGHGILTELITAYLQDVLDDVDNISGEESDLSTPYTDNLYSDAHIVQSNDEGVTTGGTTLSYMEDQFGGINGYWQGKFSGGKVTDDDYIEFKVNAKNIAVFFGKTVSSGAIIDVYIDGELTTSINTNFPGGWGSYVEVQEVASFDKSEEHTVVLRPQQADKAFVMFVTALAIS